MTLALRGVSYRYPGTRRPAVHDVDLELTPGEVVGLVGGNESGKSTLCLVCAGLAPGTIGGQLEGSVTIDGAAAPSLRSWELAQRCAILFQNPTTQLSGTAGTVWEEVAFGPRNLGVPLTEVVARVEEVLGRLGIEALSRRDPGRLSGGQAQLVALAGVLAMRPAYLVLDEPTSQLDPLGTLLVADAIAGLAAATGAGVLLVEHKTEILERVAARIAVVADGALVAAGPAGPTLADERLEGWGVAPPEQVRLARAARRAGRRLPVEALA